MNKLLVRAIKDLFRMSKSHIFIGVFGGILEAVFPFVSIFYSREILNALQQKQSMSHILNLVIWMVVLGFISMVLSSVINFFLSQNQWNLIKRIEFERNQKINRMNYEYVEDPDWIAKRRQITTFGYSSGGSLEQLVYNLIIYSKNSATVIIGLFLVVPIFLNQNNTVLDSPLFLVGFIVLFILTGFIPYWVQKSFQPIIKKQIQDTLKTNLLFNYLYGMVLFNTEAHKEMRLYNLKQYITDWLNRNLAAMFEEGSIMFVIFKTTKWVGLASIFSNQILSWILYLFLGAKALLGHMEVGSLVGSIMALTLMLKSYPELISEFALMNANPEGLKAHYEYMDLPEQSESGSLPVEKRLDSDYEFEVKDMSFAYPNSDRLTLKNINHKFEVGKSYAIVGENGSGKTTFIKLLTRLYHPTEGEIRLNDINTLKYNTAEYYSLFNVVFQDFSLFSFKLGETIASASEYDKEKILSTFKEVGFMDRYLELKDGLETVLNKEFDVNGINLSGGEQQKLAIARALYKDGPMTILDEPTSALDPISEFEVYQQFQDMVKNKTSIIISHRLSSCRFCDEILVFDEGQIVQKGNHDQLVNQPGKYRDMWNAQAQYYQEQEIDLSFLNQT